ncbi:hypothetical protein TSOC_006933, partial [Tetrabaena socialis]
GSKHSHARAGASRGEQGREVERLEAALRAGGSTVLAKGELRKRDGKPSAGTLEGKAAGVTAGLLARGCNVASKEMLEWVLGPAGEDAAVKASAKTSPNGQMMHKPLLNEDAVSGYWVYKIRHHHLVRKPKQSEAAKAAKSSKATPAKPLGLGDDDDGLARPAAGKRRRLQ